MSVAWLLFANIVPISSSFFIALDSEETREYLNDPKGSFALLVVTSKSLVFIKKGSH